MSWVPDTSLFFHYHQSLWVRVSQEILCLGWQTFLTTLQSWYHYKIDLLVNCPVTMSEECSAFSFKGKPCPFPSSYATAPWGSLYSVTKGWLIHNVVPLTWPLPTGDQVHTGVAEAATASWLHDNQGIWPEERKAALLCSRLKVCPFVRYHVL